MLGGAVLRQVLAGWVVVLPLKSYAFSPRTLQLRSMATTLQRNVGDARAANKPETYQTFLKDLRESFEAPESQEVRVRAFPTRCSANVVMMGKTM